MVYIAT